MGPRGATAWKGKQGKRPELEIVPVKGDKAKSQLSSFWFLCLKSLHLYSPEHRSLTMVWSLTAMFFSVVLVTAFCTALHLVICLVTAAGGFTEGPVKSHLFLLMQW